MKLNFKKPVKIAPVGWNKHSLIPALLAIVALVGIGLGILAGCSSKTPFDAAGYPGLTPTPSVTPVYADPTSIPNKDLVWPFNNSVTINPNLMEMNNPPNYILNNPSIAAVTAVNNFVLTTSPVTYGILPTFEGIQPSGPNGSYAYGAQGTLIDAGNAKYPAMEIEAMMEGGTAPYDGSFFTGVQFYLKIGADDNTTKRDFSIPVKQTQGPPQGNCAGGNAGGCYDNFAFNLSSVTAGQWEAFNIPFTSLAQAYAGVVTIPDPNFGGQNLQQMLWLQWEESRNNQVGTSTFDYWVADISFY
jgi:hypothetical protein